MSRPVLKRQSNYCYEDGVLKNKFDLHDAEKLDALARDITTFRISQLGCENHVVQKFFQLEDYLNLHQYLLSDIFPFAGEIRDEPIYKSNEPYFTGENNKTCIFADPGCIVIQLKEYFRKMQFSAGRIKTRDDLLNFISYYYGEINFIHPFREGNGRTLRTYMKLLVDYMVPHLPEELQNLEIDYSLWDANDRQELLKATIICGVTLNDSYIKNCFDKVLVEKHLTKGKKR